MTERHVDDILGRQVLARNNEPAGRLEELRASDDNGELRVQEYVIGAGGLLERLGVGFRRLVGSRVSGKVARWDQIDLSDPLRPRLTCAKDDLKDS